MAKKQELEARRRALAGRIDSLFLDAEAELVLSKRLWQANKTPVINSPVGLVPQKKAIMKKLKEVENNIKSIKSKIEEIEKIM